MCSLRSGNFDFIGIATHARWGDDSLDARQAEPQMLSDWIDPRFKDKFFEDQNLLVMGDFNTPKLTDPIFGALASHGLQVRFLHGASYSSITDGVSASYSLKT